MKKSLTENLISSRWKKCALLKESLDRDGIRTHALRPIGLAVQRLNHSATLSVQSLKYEVFLFLF